MYYADKLGSLQDLFGTKDVWLEADAVVVGRKRYPVIDDVIILLEPGGYTAFMRRRLGDGSAGVLRSATEAFAEDIQFTFGEEWSRYSEVLPEHKEEFWEYFDVVDLAQLREARICDLGCGIGRWSYFLHGICREIILIDFSDAIFYARGNLANARNCLFFACDLKALPFRPDFADFLFCIGVLHHLPTPVLDEVRALRRWAPTLLIYIYYALENRSWYFRLLLEAVTSVRIRLCRIRNRRMRKVITRMMLWVVYVPLILLGRVLKVANLDGYVPLHEACRDWSLGRIEQEVYDRFFTRIEQRVTRDQILELNNSFGGIVISNRPAYWHFLCQR